jgi:hypothetical protein
MKSLIPLIIVIILIGVPFLNFSTTNNVVLQYTTTTSTFNEETRHSYEFPILLTNSTDFMRKLIDLLNMMNQSQNQLSLNGTSQVAQTPNDVERLNNDLSTLMDSGQITNNDYTILQSILSNTTDLGRLLQLLSNDNLNDIVSMLQKLQNTNDPTQAKQLYQNILSTINDKYKSGKMSLTDYIAALKALQSIGLSKDIDTTELKNLLNAAELKYLNNMMTLLKNTNVKIPQYNEPQISFSKGSIAPPSNLVLQPISNINMLPGFTPQVSLQFIEFLVLLGLVIVLMSILVWRRSAILSGIMKIFSYEKVVTPAETDTNKYGESVKLYWNAVNVLSKKVPINNYETHREYDFKVSQGLPDLANDFHKIVVAYELERYGNIKSDTLIEDAKRAFKNVINFQLK